MDWFKELFTGKDNSTHDIGRWSWALSLSSIVGAAGANWYHGNIINLRDLAEAIGIVVSCHGAALWAKKDTEPTCKKE